MPGLAKVPRRIAPWGVLGALVAGSACAQILGLEGWPPPGASSGDTGGASSSASNTTSGSGGATTGTGGAAVSSGGTGGGCSTATCANTFCDGAMCMGDSCVHVLRQQGAALPNQTPGDCKRTECDGAGHAIDVPDTSDTPPTTFCLPQSCNPDGTIHQMPPGPGTVCTANSPSDGTCNTDHVCVVCNTQQDTCLDGCIDSTETDTDCGGGNQCPRCPADERCLADGDCQSGHCVGGKCA